MMRSNGLVIGVCTGFVFGLIFATFGLQAYYEQATTPLQENLEVAGLSGGARAGEMELYSQDPARNSLGPNFTISYRSLDEHGEIENDVEAQRLAKGIRVLCWVMTNPSNHEVKAIHVKNTWGRRCDKLIFMSSKSDEKLGAVGLPNVTEGRNWLWAKTKEAFKYVWEHHRDEADWFMKADDDTYVVAENLRYMLSQFNTNHPVYFGCHFKQRVQQGYMSGGAGYVLSKEALRRFIEQALLDENQCTQGHEGAEDTEIGKCLEAVGVKAGDSRDTLGRYRFLPFPPEHHLFLGYIGNDSWYWRYIYHPQKQGTECCSDMVISFHYISPGQMYALEYLLYNVRVYGVSRNY